ncbi:hypothetical protein JTE90_029502 [Oedothorax gibbosus]|uniref:Uncharacterized protein n=1 Tax=Oedothorax gibbosus TaxID=931172 RepID=A0AAV6UH95_9ARAC|nr:hypothetical protein JTE90_029502 [Oedothorax gibbosus]
MNLFSFLIVCAAIVGSQSMKEEPKINFGMCVPELSKFDASGILHYVNLPENADVKELLRYMRDIFNDDGYEKHTMDKSKTENFVDEFFGKSEMNHIMADVLVAQKKANKQKSLCIINKILGDNETRDFNVYDEGFKEIIRKVRLRVKNFKYDEEKFQAFVQKFFGKSKMSDQVSELLKTGVEMSRSMLLQLLNLNIGENIQGSFFQDADLKKLLRNVRAVLQNYKIDEDEIRDFLEEEMGLGENELTEVLPQLLKIRADFSKHSLINYISRYLGDKETKWDFSHQQAEFEKLLRKLRDMIHNYIFDEYFIRGLVHVVLEIKSKQEVTKEIAELIVIGLEMLKQYLNDFINTALGDIETPSAFSQTVDLRKLELLRYRLLNNDYGEGIHHFRNFIVQVSQHQHQLMVGPVYNLLISKGETIRQSLLEFIDKILQDREGTSSKQQANPTGFRLKKRLEKLISRMKYNLSTREGVRENKLLMKKAKAGYKKLLISGFDLNGKYKRIFKDLVEFDQSSSKF